MGKIWFLKVPVIYLCVCIGLCLFIDHSSGQFSYYPYGYQQSYYGSGIYQPPGFPPDNFSLYSPYNYQPYYPPYGYQQTYNPFGSYQLSYPGCQQSYNPFGYQQPFNPYGYQQSYYPYGYQQPYQNYAWGQPSYIWQGGPSSYFPSNYGYFPPNYNYGWSPMSSPFIPYTPPYSLLTTDFTDTSGNPIRDERIDDEEYSVLSALIEEEYASSTILILNHSYKDRRDYQEEGYDYDNLIDHFDGLEDETIEDFIEKNEQSYYFEDNFTLDEDYVLVNKNQQLYNVVKISRAGLNSDEDQAIVYVEYIWASLGGEGCYFFLIKEDGVWKVQGKVQTMIA